MNGKNAKRLFGGGAGLLVASTAFLALSGMTQGLESKAIETNFHGPARHAADRIQLAQAEAAATETPVSYSSEQADRGEEEFEDTCVECHGDDLRGGLLGGPPLRGVSFEEKYANGSPAGVLFEFMSTTMPPNNPGGLSASTYADLMAYILKRNGFPAGAPLPEDVDALYNMIIE